MLLSVYNGYSQLEVINSGRVGIGMSNPASDFQIKNVDETYGEHKANTRLHMDNVNNYIMLNKGGYNRTNQIMFSSADNYYWSLGMPDSDVAGTGYEFFIGPNSGGSNPIIWIDGGGHVGLGTSSPNQDYRLTVSGDVDTPYGYWQGSDVRLKQNIESINDALIFINSFRGITFEYKNTGPSPVDEFITYPVDSGQTITNSFKKYSPISSKRYGLVAQEVQAVIPELVHENDSGYLAVNYDGFIPILIEAVKEQQFLIEHLQQELDSLKPDTHKKSSLASDVLNEVNNNSSFLMQNQPNPFSEDTKIRFWIQPGARQSNLYIYNLQGKQIRSYDIDEPGNSSIIIYGSELDAGIYLYALIVDGFEIDTKKMTLTD